MGVCSELRATHTAVVCSRWREGYPGEGMLSGCLLGSMWCWGAADLIGIPHAPHEATPAPPWSWGHIDHTWRQKQDGGFAPSVTWHFREPDYLGGAAGSSSALCSLYSQPHIQWQIHRAPGTGLINTIETILLGLKPIPLRSDNRYAEKWLLMSSLWRLWVTFTVRPCGSVEVGEGELYVAIFFKFS